MVVFTIASLADFCGYLWCVRVRARCYVAAPLKELKMSLQHFDVCFNLQEDAIFEIRFLLCDRMTE